MPKIPLTLRRCILLLPIVVALSSSVGVQAAELTFDLKIEHEQVAPNMRLIRVKQGDLLKLRWGTDQSLTLHLHGYDIEQKVEAGVIAEMKFTARATGRFPVHLHDTHERAGSHSHHEPPLVLIEVYPQ